MPERPILRKDKELKEALVQLLCPDTVYQGWHYREDGSGRYERLALREVIVPCKKATLDEVARQLPKYDPADLNPNYLFSEVIEFCPIAKMEWQKRGKQVLEEHRKYWVSELDKLRNTLPKEAIYALPFGRFINHDTENAAEHWVSQIDQAALKYSQIFQNCRAAGITADDEARIWYYIRPYIVWPTEFPGSPKHVTYIRKNMPVYIERPALTHSLLQKKTRSRE